MIFVQLAVLLICIFIGARMGIDFPKNTDDFAFYFIMDVPG